MHEVEPRGRVDRGRRRRRRPLPQPRDRRGRRPARLVQRRRRIRSRVRPRQGERLSHAPKSKAGPRLCAVRPRRRRAQRPSSPAGRVRAAEIDPRLARSAVARGAPGRPAAEPRGNHARSALGRALPDGFSRDASRARRARLRVVRALRRRRSQLGRQPGCALRGRRPRRPRRRARRRLALGPSRRRRLRDAEDRGRVRGEFGHAPIDASQHDPRAAARAALLLPFSAAQLRRGAPRVRGLADLRGRFRQKVRRRRAVGRARAPRGFARGLFRPRGRRGQAGRGVPAADARGARRRPRGCAVGPRPALRRLFPDAGRETRAESADAPRSRAAGRARGRRAERGGARRAVRRPRDVPGRPARRDDGARHVAGPAASARPVARGARHS
mmetsp:Transcript_36458/g.112784  ORF Transcript_36458/g.112784 Transcript_36458/m.112784 type:complete len:386 (-) Transcript_36458:1551-2708(-)